MLPQSGTCHELLDEAREWECMALHKSKDHKEFHSFAFHWHFGKPSKDHKKYHSSLQNRTDPQLLHRKKKIAEDIVFMDRNS